MVNKIDAKMSPEDIRNLVRDIDSKDGICDGNINVKNIFAYFNIEIPQGINLEIVTAEKAQTWIEEALKELENQKDTIKS